MPRNQPPSPIRISDRAGRIECFATLPAKASVQPCGRFMADPPLIGRTGHTKPNTISSISATM